MATPKTPTAEPAAVMIKRIGAETVEVPIIGTSPLIVHRWSAKARQQMLDAQQGLKSVKESRDPDKDYEESLYRTFDGGYGLPVLAFKSATIGAARYFGKDVTMTALRQYMFFAGVMSADETQILTPIDGEPRMREDMVRLSRGGSTDLRFRGEFLKWSAILRVTFVPTSISRESVLSLIDAGGLGVGVGEWRPEKSGQNGTYTLDESRDVKVVSR